MINFILMSLLIVLVLLALLDAGMIYKLNRRCLQIERDGAHDAGLLRWYSDGFGVMQRWARWLRDSSLVLAVFAMILGAHPALIVATILTTVLIQYERHYTRHCRRCHRLHRNPQRMMMRP